MSEKYKSQIRICFLGESFVNGTGDQEYLGWTGRICVNAHKKGHDITYYNLGVRCISCCLTGDENHLKGFSLS
jgi:hypothetical protein